MIRRHWLKTLALLSIVQPITANSSSKDTSGESKLIEQFWINYKQWLNEHFKDGVSTLNEGATQEQISRLQARLKIKLPQDYIDWLKVHNGQTIGSVGLLYSDEFLSTSRVFDEWSVMKQLLDSGVFEHASESDPAGAIKPNWWNLKWIPISADGNGNLTCIDMSADKKGFDGQIISVDHETVHRTLLAKSFKEYISNYLDDLESKRYTYSEDFDLLLPLEDI